MTTKTEGKEKENKAVDMARDKSYKNTVRLFSSLVKSWEVPPKMLVSDWADMYRRLSPESSAEAGRWRTSRAEYQREMMNAITDPKVKKVVFCTSAQIGKALDIDTPIPTPNGWSTMGDLRKGDEVFDENGEVCKVLFATNVMYGHKCYEVVFSDGSKIVADAEHNWYIESDTALSYNGRNAVHSVVLTTEQIANDYKYYEYVKVRSRYYVPEVKLFGKERRYIVSVTEVESRPVKCIGVNSPNHLYLAGKEMIPTHNSEIINNILGYYMDYDPAPIMFVMPTDAVVASYSKDRIAPMIRDTPVLKDKIVEPKSRESGNTINYKKFVGGYLVLIGANTPSQLASRPIRVVLADEVDRFPVSAGSEGDPLALAEVRQTTFWNKKTVIASTPTIKGSSKIEAEYEQSSREELNVACPQCGVYQPMKWSQIKFNHLKDQENGKNGNKFELLGYVCKECGAISNEIQWKKQPIKWVAANPEVKNIRGFHLNALASRWKTWESVVDDFLTAKKQGAEMLKVWVNTMLGESWEEASEVDFNDLLSKRRQYYNCLIPKEVVALTVGVDVQDNRLEYEIVGWGVGKKSWGIKYGIILGDPAEPKTWDSLSEILFVPYTREDGQVMNIMSTCIDSGGHKTEQVYDYCRDHFLQNVYAIKGVGGSGVPFVKIPKTLNDAGVYLFNIGVDVGKDTLYSRLKMQYESEAGYCHFPIESDRGYNEDYFVGLTSEHKITKYTKGQARIIWEKRSDRARNEPLDIRNYATAALEIKCVGLPYDLLEALSDQEQKNTQTKREEPKEEHREVVKHIDSVQPETEEQKPIMRKVTKLGAEQHIIRKKCNGGIQI